MTLGVGVREETRLENGIRRGLDVRDEVRGGKGDLSHIECVVDKRQKKDHRPAQSQQSNSGGSR